MTRKIESPRFKQQTMEQTELLKAIAKSLGYEKVDWDNELDCWCGFGSTDPTDRSNDDEEGRFITKYDSELVYLFECAAKAIRWSRGKKGGDKS